MITWLYSGKKSVYLSVGSVEPETHAFESAAQVDPNSIDAIYLEHSKTSLEVDKTKINKLVRERIMGGFGTVNVQVQGALHAALGARGNVTAEGALVDEFDAGSLVKGRVAYTKQTEKGAFNGWGDANGAHDRAWEGAAELLEDEGLPEEAAAAPAAASEPPPASSKPRGPKAHGAESPRGRAHGSESPRLAKQGAKAPGNKVGKGAGALDSRRKA